jgi:hypothetical protein
LVAIDRNALVEQRPGRRGVGRQFIEQMLVIVEHHAIDVVMEVDRVGDLAVRDVVELRRLSVVRVHVIVDPISDLQDGDAAVVGCCREGHQIHEQLDRGVARRLVVGLRIHRLHRRHVGVGDRERRGRPHPDLDVADCG